LLETRRLQGLQERRPVVLQLLLLWGMRMIVIEHKRLIAVAGLLLVMQTVEIAVVVMIVDVVMEIVLIVLIAEVVIVIAEVVNHIFNFFYKLLYFCSLLIDKYFCC
jgi:hypothetical protein